MWLVTYSLRRLCTAIVLWAPTAPLLVKLPRPQLTVRPLERSLAKPVRPHAWRVFGARKMSVRTSSCFHQDSHAIGHLVVCALR
jgi:hypothetical protein